MTKKKKAAERSYDDLPEHIMRKILLNLPVKPLMVSRCVSPEWLNIISDGGFVKTHTQHHRPPLTRRVLISTAAEDGLLRSVDLDDPAQDRYLHCPFIRPDHSPIRLLSTCNGLVFASDDYLNCYIWNPSTGFYGNVPLPLAIRREKIRHGGKPHSFEMDHFGLGYISSSDDYKMLVAITTDFDPAGKGWIDWVYVYSWRSGTWTKIESPFNHWIKRIAEERTDVFVNDNFHWFDDILSMNASSYDEEEEEPLEDGVIGAGILAFDLVRHEFRKINLPPNYDDDEPDDEVLFDNYMGVWRENSLYVLRFEKDDTQSAELWFINEYGVNVEWIRYYDLNLEVTIVRHLVFQGGYVVRLNCIDLEQDNADNIIQLHPGNYNFFAFQETLLCPERQVKPNLKLYNYIKRRSLNMIRRRRRRRGV